MDKEATLEIIRKEVAGVVEKKDQWQDAPIAVIRGCNTQSAKTLLDQDLTIRYFPFHIGRGGDTKTFMSEQIGRAHV